MIHPIRPTKHYLEMHGTVSFYLTKSAPWTPAPHPATYPFDSHVPLDWAVSPQASSSSTLPNIRYHAHALLAHWRLAVIEQPHHVPLYALPQYAPGLPPKLRPSTRSSSSSDHLGLEYTPDAQVPAPCPVMCNTCVWQNAQKKQQRNYASQYSRQNQMKIDVVVGRLAYKQCGWWRQDTLNTNSNRYTMDHGKCNKLLFSCSLFHLIVIIIKYHTQKNAQTKVIKPAKVVIKCQNSESMLHVNCRMVLYLKRSWLWCTLVILVGTTWNALELIIRYIHWCAKILNPIRKLTVHMFLSS
jgi:hypothetical protein